MNGDEGVFWHHHLGVSVPDLDAAITWYGAVLGFELEHRRHLERVPCEMAMLRNGALRVELFALPHAHAPAEDRTQPDIDLRAYGNKHVSFGVSDVESLAQRLRERGADIVWVRKFTFGSNLFLRDNSGNLIEFVQAAPPPDPFALL